MSLVTRLRITSKSLLPGRCQPMEFGHQVPLALSILRCTTPQDEWLVCLSGRNPAVSAKFSPN